MMRAHSTTNEVRGTTYYYGSINVLCWYCWYCERMRKVAQVPSNRGGTFRLWAFSLALSRRSSQGLCDAVDERLVVLDTMPLENFFDLRVDAARGVIRRTMLKPEWFAQYG